jgi:hypothetical protein
MGGPVHVWVCDYAASHGDGTFTVVRGGIDKVEAPELPAEVLVWLFVEIDAGALTPGDHPVTTSIVTAAGVPIFDVKGMLTIRNEAGLARFVLPMSCTVQAFEKMKVRVVVGEFLAERDLTVTKKGGDAS